MVTTIPANEKEDESNNDDNDTKGIVFKKKMDSKRNVHFTMKIWKELRDILKLDILCFSIVSIKELLAYKITESIIRMDFGKIGSI